MVMTRPERHQVDVEEYYREKEMRVAMGETVWVENFDLESDCEYRFTGLFRACRLVALIKECNVVKNPPRYPMIYGIKDGTPVPRRTTRNYEEARRVVERGY